MKYLRNFGGTIKRFMWEILILFISLFYQLLHLPSLNKDVPLLINQ